MNKPQINYHIDKEYIYIDIDEYDIHVISKISDRNAIQQFGDAIFEKLRNAKTEEERFGLFALALSFQKTLEKMREL